MQKMKIVGITGAIGCGKTTLANMIRKLGYEVFDADKEVGQLYENKEFLNVIKNNFPLAFDNGIFDKKKLRKIVFSNQKELLKLETLIEPFLQKLFQDKIKEVSHGEGIFFVDAVLLFEKGWHKYCDKVICVKVDLETQKQRVMKRDKISEKEFFDIYYLQMNSEKKCALADEIIDTGCSLEELEEKAKNVVRNL